MRHDAHFVEDLTVGREQPVGKMLALDQIEPDPDQPRGTLGDLSELIASVQDKGVLEPILVRPNPQGDEDNSPPYRIISGERRYQAALEAGLMELPAIEMDVDETEALEIALVENLQRKDLTPFEEGEGYRRLNDLHGYTHEQIAEAMGKSRTVITESLALLDLPERARERALELGLKSKSLLLEIVKATTDEAEILALLEQVSQQGWTRDDLREVAKRRPVGEDSTARSGSRAKPYVFRFKDPDKTFNLSLSFRRSTVDRGDLITALEQILQQLKESEDPVQ